MDVDPVGLVRRGRGRSSFSLAQYLNDRPYVASSFFSVAIVTVFKPAMAGTSKGRPELAATAIPLEASLPAVPARAGEELIRRLFEPLGYEVEATPLALDHAFPDWGTGRLTSLTLRATVRLADLLNHLYVLFPVLDDEKHYVEAYRRYVWPVAGVGDLRVAPFHVLAAESGVFVDRDHPWHLDLCDRLVAADPEWVQRTERRVVDVTTSSASARRSTGGPR